MTENTVPSSMGRGSVSGLAGAIALVVMQYFGIPDLTAVPLSAMVATIAAGLLRRFVARAG